MCGIAGFTFEDPVLIRKMCDVIKQRGPDDEGYYSDTGITLGSRRLAIIDLEGGHQPIHNEDKSIVTVYNGMIYNFKELRASLEREGHRFYTNTDTEVIVHAYEQWGEECVKRFDGMFAFALWDSNRKRLMLARDQCGIKPLYYTILGDGSIIFASEIKAILQSPAVRREIDTDAFHYYINLRFIPKEKTLFKGISRLLPGHYLTMDAGGLRTRQYWDIVPEPKEYSEDYLVKRLEELLNGAVKRHLISDVPVGVYLSGGMDSSTVVALASKAVDSPLKTFTMGFGEHNDELSDARFVADYFNTEHREIIIHSTLLEEYPKMIWYADMPKRNLYPYYITREVSKYVKVVLSGLGGDELFAGYEWKYEFAQDVEAQRKKVPARLMSEMQLSAAKLIKHLSHYGALHEIEYVSHLKRIANLQSNVDLYLMVMSLDEVFSKEYLKRIYGSKLLDQPIPPVKNMFEPYFNSENNRLCFTDQVLLADFKVKMADDFLYVDDAMSMANSLEGRYPFLDRSLLEFAFTIPHEYKFHRGEGKYVLKKVMRKVLPKRVIGKIKQGFGGNVGIQFSGEIADYARQLLPEGYAVKEKLVKKRYVEDVLNRRASMNLVKHYTVLWNLLAFEVWYRLFILPDEIRKPEQNMDQMFQSTH